MIRKQSIFAPAFFAALVFILAAGPAQALMMNMTVNVDFGFLDGQSFTGSFDFDPSGLTNVGEEFVEVDALTFDFPGGPYTLADVVSDFTAEVVYFDGDFLGLEYATEDITFSAGFFSVDEASFTHEPAEEDMFSSGEVSFTVIPVPAAAFVFAMGLGGIAAFSRKRF